MLWWKVLASRETGTGIRGIFLSRFSQFWQDYGPVQVQTQTRFTYYTNSVHIHPNATSLKMTVGLPWKFRCSVSFSSSQSTLEIQSFNFPWQFIRHTERLQKRAFQNEEILGAILLNLLPTSNIIFSIEL